EEQPREGKRFAFRQNAHDPYIDCLSAIDLLIEPSLQRHERAMDDGPVHVRSFEVPAKDIGVSEPSPRLIVDDSIQCVGLIGVTACCEVHELKNEGESLIRPFAQERQERTTGKESRLPGLPI